MWKEVQLLGICLLYFQTCGALFVPIGMPEKLKECYRSNSKSLKVTQVPSQIIAGICEKGLEYRTEEYMYPSYNLPHNTDPYVDIPKDTQNYVDGLLRKVAPSEDFGGSRTKRAAIRLRNTTSVRKEVRAMPQHEWDAFANAVNSLKNRKVITEISIKYFLLDVKI